MAVVDLVHSNTSQVRDYAVAAKLFTFYLTDDANYPDEHALFGSILSRNGHNTPVLGWVLNEVADVGFMSGPSYGKFVNVLSSNHSVWASFRGPSSYSQPAPAAVKANAGTVL